MSTRRLAVISTIPTHIQTVFDGALPPATPEISIWRERAARMTLDAMGHTNLTVKPHEHNYAVRYARRWFRGVFADLEDSDLVDDQVATFDAAGVLFEEVRDLVLATQPIMLDEKDDDDEDFSCDPAPDSV